MCVSSLPGGYASLGLLWKAGEARTEAADWRGLWPQLKMEGGGREGIADCLEGTQEGEVFLVEEKSWDR